MWHPKLQNCLITIVSTLLLSNFSPLSVAGVINDSSAPIKPVTLEIAKNPLGVLIVEAGQAGIASEGDPQVFKTKTVCPISNYTNYKAYIKFSVISVDDSHAGVKAWEAYTTHITPTLSGPGYTVYYIAFKKGTDGTKYGRDIHLRWELQCFPDPLIPPGVYYPR